MKFNTYVINLVSQENNSDTENNSSQSDMIEIENTKLMLSVEKEIYITSQENIIY